MPGNEEIIRIKKEYRCSLVKRFELLFKDLGTERSEANKVGIQIEIDSLQAEIEQLDFEIQRLEQSLANSPHLYRNYSQIWDEKLPQINFDKSRKLIRGVFERFSHEDGVGEALFLIQRSHSMGGNLCIRHIKALLQDMGNWYPPFEYGFASHQQVHPINFLNSLADRLQVESFNENIERYTTQIIEKMCGALRSGNILFIQVEIHYLNPKDTFLEWFVRDFWHHIVEAIQLQRQERPLVRVVAVIAVRDSVPESCLLDSLCCTRQKLSGKKLLELPLQNWTEEEIRNWLWRFSGLDAPHVGLKRSEIEQMARSIYQVSKGKPSEVHHGLLEEMRRHVS